MAHVSDTGNRPYDETPQFVELPNGQRGSFVLDFKEGTIGGHHRDVSIHFVNERGWKHYAALKKEMDSFRAMDPVWLDHREESALSSPYSFALYLAEKAKDKDLKTSYDESLGMDTLELCRNVVLTHIYETVASFSDFNADRDGLNFQATFLSDGFINEGNLGILSAETAGAAAIEQLGESMYKAIRLLASKKTEIVSGQTKVNIKVRNGRREGEILAGLMYYDVDQQRINQLNAEGYMTIKLVDEAK